MNVGSNQLCSMANAIGCDATGRHLDRVLSPQTVLAYIVDFLTLGSVRRSNERVYTQLQNAFENLRMFSYEVPTSLQSDTCVLGDIDDHSLSIILPGINHPEGPITVRISSGKQNEEVIIARNDIKHPILREIVEARYATTVAHERNQRMHPEERVGTLMNKSIRFPSGIVVCDPLFSDG